MIFFAFNILTAGVPLSMVCAVIGLAAAFFLIAAVVRSPAGNERMQEIAGAVQEGAKAYLNRQVITISVIAVIIFVLLFIFKDHPTAIGFVIGAFCSLVAGFIGMRIAVIANVRTTQAATVSITKALRMAFNGGAVTGLLVVGLALLAVSIFYTVVSRFVGPQMAINSLVGLALGASLISVFARLGGGIYTKAADVGADLVGKIEAGIPEDDPRNPAVIADNVGDIGVEQEGLWLYPLALGGISILASVIGTFFTRVGGGPNAIINALYRSVIVATVLSAAGFIPVTMAYDGGGFDFWNLYGSALIGLAVTFLLVAITEYYTGTRWKPVKDIAKASQTGHATNIISGLAVGMQATALPVIVIAVGIVGAYYAAGESLYGIGVAVMAQLSMAGLIVALDAYGPVTDNAGGIAEMADLPEGVRGVTDPLDAVGNTTKAVTKGYAIGSAGLAALILFDEYGRGLREDGLETFFSLDNPWVVAGLFIGGLMPFLFASLAMQAVGRVGGQVVEEVRRQFREVTGIMAGTSRPDYSRAIGIVTTSAIKEMLAPALIPVLIPIMSGSSRSRCSAGS